MNPAWTILAALSLAGPLLAASPGPAGDSGSAGTDWPAYHGSPYGTHYSRLDQINLGNVQHLKLAWSYDTGDAFGQGPFQSDMEGNPLIVDGRMFLVSPKGRLICLDAATGKEIWAFDPADGAPVRTKQRLRGVSYWSEGAEARILFTFRQSLLAVDARTGALIKGFGKDGRVDLRAGLDREPAIITVTNVTPGVVYKDMIVLGSTGNTPGHVRAFDVRTGKLRWIFHTIPYPGEPGYETWPRDAWKTAMGTNVWAGMSLDPDRGMIYLPVASAGMGNKDFYGADRLGDNLFGTAIVALDANTGRRLWHFQLVRHDLWDRDAVSPPTLVTVERDGKSIPALAEATKSGFVYVLNRETGESLFPLEERMVPASDIPGEAAAKSQLFPLMPAPFARQTLTADMLTTRTPSAHKAVADMFAGLSSRGPFDPPSLRGAILLPGMDGGAEWGASAFDPQTGLLYVNANEMAWILRLKPRPASVAGATGSALYQNNCAACHGADRKGNPPEIPALIGVGDRLPGIDMLMMVASGGGRMPGFGKLGFDGITAVVEYLRTGKDSALPVDASDKSVLAAPSGDDFIFDGYTKFLDPDGYPAIAPPWGTLSAIDLKNGAYAWKIPFGEYPELAKQGLGDTGSENYGGAVVTAGGLLFIGATVYDNKFHAYDKRTGKLLWETTLPAAGCATPATYMAGGRQYVVIAAGGGKNVRGSPGGKVLAFALEP
jgi:quinoprotein glucose dehydrogenase